MKLTEELLKRYVFLCYLESEEEFKFGDVEKKEQKQIKKQILENQEKATKLDFYLHEVCYCNTATGKKENCLCHCHKLEQEIKQLKEKLTKAEDMYLLCNTRREELLQKLEKIQKECDKEPRAYISASFIKKILEE